MTNITVRGLLPGLTIFDDFAFLPRASFLQFEATKRKRKHKQFRHISLLPQQPSLLWNYDKRCWEKDATGNGGSIGQTPFAPCHSLKAFIRHLKKHPEILQYQPCLVNRYIGFDVTACSNDKMVGNRS